MYMHAGQLEGVMRARPTSKIVIWSRFVGASVLNGENRCPRFGSISEGVSLFFKCPYRNRDAGFSPPDLAITWRPSRYLICGQSQV